MAEIDVRAGGSVNADQLTAFSRMGVIKDTRVSKQLNVTVRASLLPSDFGRFESFQELSGAWRWCQAESDPERRDDGAGPSPHAYRFRAVM